MTRWVLQRPEEKILQHLYVFFGHYDLSEDRELIRALGNVVVFQTFELNGGWPLAAAHYLARRMDKYFDKRNVREDRDDFKVSGLLGGIDTDA